MKFCNEASSILCRCADFADQVGRTVDISVEIIVMCFQNEERTRAIACPKKKDLL